MGCKRPRHKSRSHRPWEVPNTQSIFSKRSWIHQMRSLCWPLTVKHSSKCFARNRLRSRKLWCWARAIVAGQARACLCWTALAAGFSCLSGTAIKIQSWKAAIGWYLLGPSSAKSSKMSPLLPTWAAVRRSAHTATAIDERPSAVLLQHF